MLDTNAINFALDYRVIADAFKDLEIFTTHVQRNELEATQLDARRYALLAMLKTIDPQQIPTESLVWGVSEWGNAKWGVDALCESIFRSITVVDINTGKQSSDRNRWGDALIAETAIKHQLALITNDKNLSQVAAAHGAVQVITFEDFLQLR